MVYDATMFFVYDVTMTFRFVVVVVMVMVVWNSVALLWSGHQDSHGSF